jgi:hypothetical protein
VHYLQYVREDSRIKEGFYQWLLSVVTNQVPLSDPFISVRSLLSVVTNQGTKSEPIFVYPSISVRSLLSVVTHLGTKSESYICVLSVFYLPIKFYDLPIEFCGLRITDDCSLGLGSSTFSGSLSKDFNIIQY